MAEEEKYTLRELIDVWRFTADVPGEAEEELSDYDHGRKDTYEECADQLEEALEWGAHNAESKREIREMFE